MKRQKLPIKALPFIYYYAPVVILVLLGIICSVYLSISHYRVYTDIGYSSFCAISKSINCDTVSQSPYSIFLSLPVPVWGVWGYLFIGIFVIVSGLKSYKPKRLWRVIFLMTTLFCFISIYLALVSTLLIKSYCIVCITLYAINMLLTYYSWLIPRRFSSDPFLDDIYADLRSISGRLKLWSTLPGLLLVIIFIVWFAYPSYWEFKTPTVNEKVKTGMTQDGHPWIGAEVPKITINEFADYQCFQCRKMHFHLRRIIARSPDNIRLIHRHYPMDHLVNPIVKTPLHEGSAAMALFAIQAGLKGKFWEANDQIYRMAQDIGSVDSHALAEKIGLSPRDLTPALNDPIPFRILLEDIRSGMRLGISGTPSYSIDGVVYEGRIPNEIMAKIHN